MNKDEINKLLGILAGGLAGRKAGKGEPIGGVIGGLAGAVGGLFAATITNSIEKLSRFGSAPAANEVPDSELRESLAELRGLVNGLIMGLGAVAGLLDGLGISEKQLFAQVGASSDSDINSFLIKRKVEIQASVERAILEFYDAMEVKFSPLWKAFDLGKDKESNIRSIRESIGKTINQRAG